MSEKTPGQGGMAQNRPGRGCGQRRIASSADPMGIDG
jgi:hypothetical protein